MGDEKNRPDRPGIEVVVQNKEIWSSIFENGALHFRIGGVDDSGAKRLRLALELERGVTRGTDVVDRGGALWRRPKAW